MSVKDYIKNHYSPYMCGDGRHKWEVIYPASKARKGLEICKWCKAKKKILYLTIIDLLKKSNKIEKKLNDVLLRDSKIFVK